MRTLLCAFEDHDTGLGAMTRLIQAGFPRDDLHLQPAPGSYARVDATADAVRAGSRPAAALPSLLRWVGDCLAGPAVPGEPGTYRDAIRRRSTVVVVHVADDVGADRAADLMASFGAFDVERRVSRPTCPGPRGAA